MKMRGKRVSNVMRCSCEDHKNQVLISRSKEKQEAEEEIINELRDEPNA